MVHVFLKWHITGIYIHKDVSASILVWISYTQVLGCSIVRELYAPTWYWITRQNSIMSITLYQCTIHALSHPTSSCLTQRSKLPFSVWILSNILNGYFDNKSYSFSIDVVSNNNRQKAWRKLYSRVADKSN